ncbi:MAG: hypothetical protein WD872_02835 [Pirellulaceae bacterium]
MSLAPLLPIAGFAAASLAGEALAAVSSGLSFAAELVGQARGAESAGSDADRPTAGQQFEATVDQFIAQLRQRLSAVGMKLSGTVQIQSDGLFGVEVQGNPTDEASLERLFAADQSLRDQFNLLAEENERQSGASQHEFGLLIEGVAAEVIRR